ncbi:MAG TPA: phosphotransferase family protein [Amycolatopsis sp.]|nr:phosphotransferase family protein [Amycolatopsis sp.]
MSATPVDIDDIVQRAGAVLRQTVPDASVTSMEPLPGGASSLTYQAAVSGGPDVPDRVVVKVAPPGLAPVRNRDVLRQARLLSVLWDVDGICVPRVFGGDEGDPPEVPPLFVMSFEPGGSYEPLRTTADVPPTAAELAGRTGAAIAMLAALQQPELVARFPDEPVVTLADEIDRWSRALSTVDPEWAPGAAACEKALAAARPAALPPVVLHGDWRLGNMQCAGFAVRAVIDWEIWSIGDPRLDLAWFCMMMDPRHPGVIVQRSGVPAVERIVTDYQAATGAPVGDFAWFLALTAYKQAATSALICKNAFKRGRFGAAERRRVALVAALLRWSGELLDSA